MSELKRIRTEEEYERALAEMNRLFDAEPDTPEGERLFLLVLLIGAYEQDAHYIPPPSDEDRLEFLLEKTGRGWVSVEDRLPDDSRVVPLAYETGTPGAGYYSTLLETWVVFLGALGARPAYRPVVLWYDLPAPPA